MSTWWVPREQLASLQELASDLPTQEASDAQNTTSSGRPGISPILIEICSVTLLFPVNTSKSKRFTSPQAVQPQTWSEN